MGVLLVDHSQSMAHSSTFSYYFHPKQLYEQDNCHTCFFQSHKARYWVPIPHIWWHRKIIFWVLLSIHPRFVQTTFQRSTYNFASAASLLLSITMSSSQNQHLLNGLPQRMTSLFSIPVRHRPNHPSFPQKSDCVNIMFLARQNTFKIINSFLLFKTTIKTQTETWFFLKELALVLCLLWRY